MTATKPREPQDTAWTEFTSITGERDLDALHDAMTAARDHEAEMLRAFERAQADAREAERAYHAAKVARMEADAAFHRANGRQQRLAGKINRRGR